MKHRSVDSWDKHTWLADNRCGEAVGEHKNNKRLVFYYYLQHLCT